MRPHFDLTLTFVRLVALFAFGVSAIQTRSVAPLHITLVPANVPRAATSISTITKPSFDKFARLSKVTPYLPPPTLTFLSGRRARCPNPSLKIRKHSICQPDCQLEQSRLLLGAIDEEPHQVYNAALLFRPEGDPQLYRKVHLVPFGEYVPFRHSFPLFAEIVGDQVPEDFDAGKEFTVFQLSNHHGKVAPLICFEDTIGELTRQFVLRGADFFANVTNDGWFLRSAGSRQHLANAIFRCVENRRPMVRAANTGVTCFVNEFGRVTQVLRDDQDSIFEEGTLIGEINIATEPSLTFYAQHGELFAKICTGKCLRSRERESDRRLRRERAKKLAHARKIRKRGLNNGPMRFSRSHARRTPGCDLSMSIARRKMVTFLPKEKHTKSGLATWIGQLPLSATNCTRPVGAWQICCKKFCSRV